MTLSIICNVIVNVLNVFTAATPVTFLLLVSPANSALFTKLLVWEVCTQIIWLNCSLTCDKSAPNIENLNGSTKTVLIPLPFNLALHCILGEDRFCTVLVLICCLRDYCQQSCPGVLVSLLMWKVNHEAEVPRKATQRMCLINIAHSRKQRLQIRTIVDC